MRFTKTVASFFLAGIAGAAGTAQAQDGLGTSPNGPYVQGNLGLSIVQDSEISGGGLTADVDFDNGFTFGGGVGYRFAPFRVQADLSYRESDVESVDFGALGVLDGAGDVSVFTPMLNAFYDIDLGGRIVPFIGGGIGFAFVDVDSDNSATLVVNDSDNAFAWNAIGGASFGITDNVAIVGFYRYLQSGDFDLDASVPALALAGSLEADGISAHEINLGVRVSF